MEKLKPCPFCGAEPKMEHLVYPNIEIWFVKCVNCCAEINDPSDTKGYAIKAWNKRTRKNSHGEIECDFDRGIMQKDDIKKAIDYLDWYFEADNGTADKDAQRAWYIIKNTLVE